MAKKEILEYDKLNLVINELKMNVNQKEDDIKNIINEKDIIIKELKDKIIEQDNKIENINRKFENIINAFINEFKEKDKEINQINLNLLEQDILIEKNDKQIKNIINENIYEINNKIQSQEQKIFYELQNFYDSNEEKTKEIEKKERLDEDFLRKMNIIKELNAEFQVYKEKEKILKEIEKNELYNEIKIYKILEGKFPDHKLQLLDKNEIKKYIDLYKKEPCQNSANYYQIKEEELMLKHFKEDRQLFFKKKLDYIKSDIEKNFKQDLDSIKKECELKLNQIQREKNSIRYAFTEKKKEVDEKIIENKGKKMKKKEQIKAEYMKKVLEIENKKNKTQNLIKKEDYYNKMKNSIQFEKI